MSDSGGRTPSELSSPSPSFPWAYTASSASRRAHPDHDPPFRAHTQHRTPTAPRHQRPPASPLRVTTEPELRRPRRAPGELASVAYAGVGDGMAPSCRSRSRRGCRSRMVTSRGQPPLCGRRLCRSNGAGLEPREETCIGCSRRDSARVSGRAADNKSPGRGRIPAQRRVSVRRAYDRDARNTFSTTAPARGPELSKIADKLPAASAGYRSRLACRQRVQCLNFSCFSRSFTASFVGMMGFHHVVFTGGVAWEWPEGRTMRPPRWSSITSRGAPSSHRSRCSGTNRSRREPGSRRRGISFRRARSCTVRRLHLRRAATSGAVRNRPVGGSVEVGVRTCCPLL